MGYLCLEGVHLNCVHEISSFMCDGFKKKKRKKISLNESTFTLTKLQFSLVAAKLVGRLLGACCNMDEQLCLDELSRGFLFFFSPQLNDFFPFCLFHNAIY